MLGAAISTAVPASGSLSCFVAADVGAIATQSWVNPYLGIDGLDLLRRGIAAEEGLRSLIAADPGRETRQLGLVDRNGGAAAFTGADCSGWAGHLIAANVSVQGNMLTGAETLTAMMASFRATAEVDLPERLVRVMEAGQAAGGDKRGRQSAALRIFHVEAYPYLDLRVDEHVDPVRELRRVFEVARRQFLPFVAHLPTRTEPVRPLPPEVTGMLLRSPADR